MADISHLAFERFPKTLYRLIVAWRSRSRHTLPETVLFHQCFGFLCCILTTSVAVVYRTVRYVRVSPDRHFKCVLYYFLTLMFVYVPTYQSSCRNIYYSAYIDVTAKTFQLCYVGTPQIVRLCDSKFVLYQILFYVLFLCRLYLFTLSVSAAFGCQSIRAILYSLTFIPLFCNALRILILL